MAEIVTIDPTGNTLYFFVTDSSGQYWNGTAFETYNAANIATYDVAMTEDGAVGIYRGTFPGGIAAGVYEIVVKRQAGGAPAVADIAVGIATYIWDATTLRVSAVVPDTQKVDLNTIKTQAVTCGASVTVGAYIGGTGAAALETTAQLILTDTLEIGPAGSGLTDITGVQLAADQAVNVTKWGGTVIASVYVRANTAQWGGGSLPTVGDATAANQTTILNRIGAFTGAGWNTILGFFRALLRKDGGVTLPTDIGGSFDNTTDSVEAIADGISTASQIADAVLSCNVSNVEAASPQTSLATLVLATTNKANTEDSAGYLIVYRTDGETPHAIISISVDPNADPIEGIGG